ncbi:MAG: ABC transporter permease [Clostridiaceae bacterium]|nr:ABC transporter permease [Clostridiaceae bacterium]
MSSLFYIIRKQFKNVFRGLAQKPLALIGYILIGIMLVGFVVIAFIMPSGLVRSSSSEIFSAGITGFILISLYLGLRQGIEKGSTYFRFADVNLVFTAPLKPSQVLLYGFIKRIGTSLFIVFFTVFQIPNIKNNFVLADYGVLAILTAVLFYSVLFPILGMVIYSFTSHSNEGRVLVKRILDVTAILFVLFFIITLTVKRSLVEAFVSYFNYEVFSYIPIAGQLSTIASAAVYGIDYKFYISIAVLVTIIGLSVAILYNIYLDYYEDVLSATGELESRLKAKRKGRDASLEKRKIRKVEGGFSSYGARAIFEKHKLEYRKVSYFLFFDKSTLLVVLMGIGFKYLMAEGGSSIFFTLFFSAYMLFFLVIQGKWPMELEKPYIFLIPEPKGLKLLYTTFTENLKNLLDGTLLFIIAYFVYDTSIPVVLLCIISYTLYGAIYIYGDIVSRRLFGSIHSRVMLIFIKLIISFFVVLPGIIIMFVIQNITGNELFSVFSVTMWNLFVTMCLFLASLGIFNNIEST